MKQIYIARLVNLAPQDYLTVRRLADEKGLGSKGFSAALRMIIREWQQFTLKTASGASTGKPSNADPKED